jgi:hypothetical protein
LGEGKESLTLRYFKHMSRRMIEDARNLLMKKWVKGIQNSLYAAAKRNIVPKANEPERMISFFNCVATLMQANLLELFHESLNEYRDFLCMRMVKKNLNFLRSPTNNWILLLPIL